MSLTLTLNRDALIGLGTLPGGPLRGYMLTTAAQVDTAAKDYLSGGMVHVITGNLRSSQSFRVENRGEEVVGIVENVAEYAVYVHEGTAPHDIVPRAGKVLTGWIFRGQPVFTPVVHHPGTTARPFLAQAMADVLGG